MNTAVTSKQALLAASEALVQEKGMGAVNIRAVAQRCEVSVGSVYNYFPSKAELVAATVEAVWRRIFHVTEACDRPEGFVNCVEWLYDCLQKGSREHPNFFTMHSLSFAANEKEQGRAMMQQYFAHMKQGLLQALREDTAVKPQAWGEAWAEEKLVDFTFSSVLMLCMHKEESCGVLLRLLRKALYEA